MSEIELKPCPFCGGEAKNNETTAPFIPKRYYVICHTCGTMSEWYSTAEEAVKAWNRRAGGEGMNTVAILLFIMLVFFCFDYLAFVSIKRGKR